MRLMTRRALSIHVIRCRSTLETRVRNAFDDMASTIHHALNETASIDAASTIQSDPCFGRPDEADCQVKCGDLYASKAVQTFNTCAVSNKKCVKQKQDTGRGLHSSTFRLNASAF